MKFDISLCFLFSIAAAAVGCSFSTKLETFSQKTIIFLLIDDYIIADDNWSDYYNDIFDKNDCVIPIALNKNALNFKNLSQIT